MILSRRTKHARISYRALFTYVPVIVYFCHVIITRPDEFGSRNGTSIRLIHKTRARACISHRDLVTRNDKYRYACVSSTRGYVTESYDRNITLRVELRKNAGKLYTGSWTVGGKETILKTIICRVKWHLSENRAFSAQNTRSRLTLLNRGTLSEHAGHYKPLVGNGRRRKPVVDEKTCFGFHEKRANGN